MSKIRTTLNLNTHARNGTEYEVEIEVEYDFHRGYAATRIDPGEPDHVEICAIKVFTDGEPVNAGWLAELLCEDEELQALCLQDAAERSIDAAEYRAEARAEALAEMRAENRA